MRQQEKRQASGLLSLWQLFHLTGCMLKLKSWTGLWCFVGEPGDELERDGKVTGKLGGWKTASNTWDTA